MQFGITKGYGHEEGYYGRGYSKETPESGVVKHILEGRNFEEQWSYALEVDPEMVFVTGWNEWIAQRAIFMDGLTLSIQVVKGY